MHKKSVARQFCVRSDAIFSFSGIFRSLCGHSPAEGQETCYTSWYRVRKLIIEEVMKILINYDTIKFSIFFTFSIFLTSDERALSGVSTPIKPIDEIFLPAGIYFILSSIRKWSQIKIWMHEPTLIFNFKSLRVSICCRPHFSSFLWHRITLRVGMRHPALRVTVIICISF